MKRKYIQVFAFIMAFILFILSPLSVYASEKWEGSLGLTLYYNKDKILQYFKDTGEFWLYGASQAGAILTSDFVKFAENKKKMDDILSEGDKIGVYVDEKDNAKGMYFSKEFMTELKALIEQYAKENEPYYIVPVPSYLDVTPSQFATKAQYTTICNLAKTYGLIGVNGRFISNLSDVREKNHVFVWSPYYNNIPENPDWSAKDIAGTYIYDQEWQRKIYTFYSFSFTSDVTAGYTSFDDGLISTDDNTTSIKQHGIFIPNYTMCNNGRVFNNTYGQSYAMTASLVSKDRCRVRVYKTLEDFKKYSVGSRKVYYTSNYYNYVPEDLSVSIDDLQKEIDDLSKVIDQLLDQITKDTDESEIEDLLRQILDELKNNPGGGSGGGDVNVDMSTTNGLLAKILAKVTQIFDKMNAAVGDAEDAAFAKIQESLDEIIVQLKKIKRWAAIDTVVDGVDAVADWLDLIKDVISDADEGVGSAVSTVAETLEDSAGMLSTKFPFSIPWDILLVVSVLAAEPQVPHFEIPIDIEMDWIGINIHYDFVIDFAQYQWLSDFSRLILSMTYAVGLMKLTMNIALLKKEE